MLDYFDRKSTFVPRRQVAPSFLGTLNFHCTHSMFSQSQCFIQDAILSSIIGPPLVLDQFTCSSGALGAGTVVRVN